MKILLTPLLLISALLLAACGQSGDLYLPKKEPRKPVQIAQPNASTTHAETAK